MTDLEMPDLSPGVQLRITGDGPTIFKLVNTIRVITETQPVEVQARRIPAHEGYDDTEERLTGEINRLGFILLRDGMRELTDELYEALGILARHNLAEALGYDAYETKKKV